MFLFPAALEPFGISAIGLLNSLNRSVYEHIPMATIPGPEEKISVLFFLC